MLGHQIPPKKGPLIAVNLSLRTICRSVWTFGEINCSSLFHGKISLIYLNLNNKHLWVSNENQRDAEKFTYELFFYLTLN